MLKIGGMTFDVAVQNMVRRNYDFLIGRQTAEALRKRFGVLGGNGKASMVVAGRNLVVGVPRYQEIPSSAVRVHVAAKPDLCAVEGLRRMINSKELKKLSYSMLDENYRWIR